MNNKAIFIPAGILFFLGVAGFLPNPVISSSGFFKVDVFHNFLHLFSGLMLLFVGVWSRKSADFVFKMFGLFFLVLSILGFLFAQSDKLFGLLTTGNSNNWLHLFFGIGLLFLASKHVVVADTPNSISQ